MHQAVQSMRIVNESRGRPASGHIDLCAPLAWPDQPGTLSVVEGDVWLTRAHDDRDHRLRRGDSFRVARGDAVVVEPLGPQAGARVSWSPQARPLDWRGRFAAWRAAGWDRLALGLGRAACAARARSAAASATWAQGCISTGDSIASCGAVQ